MIGSRLCRNFDQWGPRLIYRFDDLVLDPQRRELRRGDSLVAVEPQVFDLLEFLVRARERVVSRDDLLAAVWQGRIVSEATLSSRVNAARAAIGDSGEEQRLIRTFSRKGFRFVGIVREEVEVPARLELPTTPAKADSAAPIRTVDCRPSLHEHEVAIRSRTISPMGWPRRSSRPCRVAVACSSSRAIRRFTYKGKAVDIRRVGQELGVGYVLEGSVRRGGERLRITGQLIDASSGAHLWADRFDGDLKDVFEPRDRITESVVAAIEPALLLAEIERRKRSRPDKLNAYAIFCFASLWAGERVHRREHEGGAGVPRPGAGDRTDVCAGDGWRPPIAMRSVTSRGWVLLDETHRLQGMKLAWRAVELAPNDAQVLWMAAFAVWNLAQR